MILQWESRKRHVTLILGRHARDLDGDSEIAFLSNEDGLFDPAPDDRLEPDSGTMTEPLDFGLRFVPPPEVFTPADEFMDVACRGGV